MNKNQWTNVVSVMRLKWPNFHWSQEQIISAFDDLKGFDARHIESAIERSFKAGDEFAPNPSVIYASAAEVLRYENINTCFLRNINSLTYFLFIIISLIDSFFIFDLF